MQLKQEQIEYIDNNFFEDPDINFEILKSLDTPEELHYLATILNWDIHVPILQWIIEQPLCSQATGLMIFWLAQPNDYTKYRLDAEKIDGDMAVFDIIKTILQNYQNGFYLAADIHYDPKNDIGTEIIIPAFMKASTSGEEPYIYYDKSEVNSWFGEQLESKFKNAESAMELFNFAYYVQDTKKARMILQQPLCDKGIALMLYWRLKTYAGVYSDMPVMLKEIEKNMQDGKYPEIISYNPKADKNIRMKESRRKWAVPEKMKQAV